MDPLDLEHASRHLALYVSRCPSHTEAHFLRKKHNHNLTCGQRAPAEAQRYNICLRLSVPLILEAPELKAVEPLV